MTAPLVVDRRRPVPLHRQIYDEWRRGILEGRFPPGQRMPSTRELAASLHLSRATVATAYDQLVAEGYLEGRRGSGTFVSGELPDRGPRPAIAGGVHATPTRPRLSAFVRRLGPLAPRAPDVPGVINLSSAGPDADRFPYRTWTRLIRRHLRHARPEVFRYGSAAAGLETLREALAAYLRRSRAVQCRAEQIVIVSGSQQALDLCSRVLVDPGDEVVIEEPGYIGSRQLFAAAGARLRPVPIDGDGLRTSTLPPARLACVTPSHQFPMGVSLSLARRLELLAWAESARAFIIEDDYDSEFRYSGAPLPALQGLGDGSRVVYAGTFSNAMFPGLRIGYLVLPPPLVEAFVRAKWYADRQTGSLEQAALADFVREGHLEQHLRRMRRIYKARRDALLDALARWFGDRATVIGDAAGMHLVVRVDLPRLSRRRGVALMDTRQYYAGAARENEYIIRFAGLGERAIGEAVRRLASRQETGGRR